MSQPSRPQAHGPAQRRRRQLKFEAVQPLEERCLLAPVVAVSPILAASTGATGTQPANTSLTNVTVTLGTADTGFLSAAPFTSVSELTSASSFGGDIVRIRSGPGGPFGNDVYAISRGAGENSANLTAAQTAANNTTPSTVAGAINRPGVIYRVDPATGKTNVFFDLNTLIPQLEPPNNKGATAANSAGAATGLVNWYDITFDPEGYFDGKPSMFVSSVDRQDPTKNAIYRIAPDGTFMGLFADFNEGFSANNLSVVPSAILVPPPEDQTFLRGLFAGGGVSSTATSGAMSALFFDANAYSPGRVINTTTLPKGVSTTPLVTGPITGLTAANPDYVSRVYSVFTDFGTPPDPIAGLPGVPGDSGIQGINGDTLLGSAITTTTGTTTTTVAAPVGVISLSPNPTTRVNATTDSTVVDRYAVVPSDFRRFQDIGFDQYGYFAQGAQLGAATTTTTTGGVSATGTGSVGGTGAGGGSGTGVGQASGAIYVNANGLVSRPGITLPPASAGNLFVADLASGLSVSVPVPAPPNAPAGTVAQSVRVPVQGPETIAINNAQPLLLPGGAPNPNYNTPTITITPAPGLPGLGGRVVRITPTGILRDFAYNFHTSNAIDSSGFAMSSLSLSFSADGTTLYVADDDGVWQFKTVTSLAGSTSGSITGLNDLRSLGVPYDGKGSAVAVIDTGVDAFSTPFRGRVATGTNVYLNNGAGTDDTAVFGSFSATATGANGGNNGSNTTNPAPATTADGHGTPVAGVVAQFVPQATIVPVNIFAPFLTPSTSTQTNTGGNGNNGGVTVTANSNAVTTANVLYQGLDYVTKHPFANDPVRPGGVSRVIATTMAFGTTETFDSEGSAYKRYPQILISLKDQMKKFRSLGIAPIAAAGQFGAPFAAGISTGTTNGGNNNNNNTGTGPGNAGNNNSSNAAVGDIQGISLPAILNEVVSVTGSYSYPFFTGPGATPANSNPVDQPVLLSGHTFGPVLVFGNSLTIGGGAVATGATGGGGASATSATSLPGLLANADTLQYADRILGSANRNVTTDYAAPAIDVPTFRRTFLAGTTTTGTGTATVSGQDSTDHNAFNDAGTSLSAAEVTGAFALVSSALGYWSNLAKTGYTADAYLTQPVGVRTLNFGQHRLIDLTAWNNPDGINAILQWTAVPASISLDGTTVSTPKMMFGTQQYPSFSRISVSNAIAAIEGYEALNYLINVGALSKLDANNNGIITATELQNFEDTAAAKGMPTVGAMARLLGGTARISTNLTFPTLFGETPDQPDVLQRRFNFFDYSADGALNGSISIAALKMLSHTVLPKPDQFVIVDRQKSSANGYLVAPATLRNYNALQHIAPTYQFISPGRTLTKYRNVSPAGFGVNKGLPPSTSNFPVFTLFDPVNRKAGTTAPAATAPAGTTPAVSVGSGGAQVAGTQSATAPASSGTVTTAAAPANSASTGTTTTVTSTSPGFVPYTSGQNSVYTATIRSSLGVPAPVGTVTSLTPTTTPVVSTPSTTTTSAQSTAKPKTKLQSFLKTYLGIKV